MNMKSEERIINNFKLNYPIDKLANIQDVLFLDIETTGFLSSNSSIYLIGCAFYNDDNWVIKQFFANDKDEEKQLLVSFFDFAKNYRYLIHFNGNTFDLPFINAKAEKYELFNPLSDCIGTDLYRRILPYKNLLKLNNCKQKTLEEFLDINREDRYSGGELIDVYNEYLNSHDYDLYQMLMLHNFEDMKGMLEILPILSYYDLFNSDLLATKVVSNAYKDINGFYRKELLINISFSAELPKEISFMGKGCYFKAEGSRATLIVPIYEEELKYFYANYKDYYYLPLEDMAVHKSIASFVDKDYREKATASNCYTRKYSEYLPQWTILVEPFFKRDYKSTDLFFELTDEFKQNRDLFGEYAHHIITEIAFQI